jgi:hypothetical protein
MTDKEFLDYCDAMTETPRCGFVPSNIARIFRLAGDQETAKTWDDQPNRVVNCGHGVIRNLVKQARERMKNQ